MSGRVDQEEMLVKCNGGIPLRRRLFHGERVAGS